MRFKRYLDETLASHFTKYKEILTLMGARQVGKTTIVKKLFPKAIYLTLDNESIRTNLERYDISIYRQLLPSSPQILILDEIHLLSDPGRAAKIFFDQMPETKLIITGSSAFTIKHKVTESLAGRKIEYRLFPLTFSEWLVQSGIENNLSYRILTQLTEGKLLTSENIHSFDCEGLLINILRFGSYPALLEKPQNTVYLENLIDSAVFRDILDLHYIENRPIALSLLKLLAYQIGSQVNFSELANKLSVDAKTVKRYISIFEQSYIIFLIYPYAKKGRDEIGKMPKVYFFDTGLRNALIGNFQNLYERVDAGALFENFIAKELFILNNYGRFGYSIHYWRTRQGSEVDIVLAKGDELVGIEVKTQDTRLNRAFFHRYPHATGHVITRKNFY